MKLNIEPDAIEIIVESPQDAVYLQQFQNASMVFVPAHWKELSKNGPGVGIPDTIILRLPKQGAER